MTRAKVLALLSAAALLASCGSEADGRLTPGSYGGNHISIVVELQRTQFLFDCASGVVDGAIPVDGHGGFDVTGTYTLGGNAQGVDHTPKPARYLGSVSDNIVTFSLFVPATASTPVDIYTATRGATPQIAAC